MFTATVLALSLAQLAAADAAVTGNCLSQRVDFKDSSRIFNLQGVPPTAVDSMTDLASKIDPARYDFTIDYGNDNSVKTGNGVALTISKNPAGGDPIGTRISSTRMMKFGKITASLKAVALPGVVNTLITAGPPLPDSILAGVPKANIAQTTGDEIDIELLGKTPKQGTNNVFYRGIAEYSKHDATYAIPNGMGVTNTYSIEWKHNTISWSVNGNVVRTYKKDGPEANSEFVPGIRFFPDRPQKVQLALWSIATNTWAGGMILLAFICRPSPMARRRDQCLHAGRLGGYYMLRRQRVRVQR
ncbi:hypothetical protein HDV03_003490 [Kappamyces sp. JEL0829]|nr:hypothetical protein HDV03_003490 [Kappamyces sp. JEL0829]